MTTLIELDELTTLTDRDAAPAPMTLRPPGTGHPTIRSRTVPRYGAPSRFDVHAVAGFRAWASAMTSAGASRLVVDCSRIDFVDLAGIEAIAEVGAQHCVELADPSLAALVTFRLLDSTVWSDEPRDTAVAA